MEEKERIFDLFDWNNPKEKQEEGLQLARQVRDLTIFLQPISEKHNKNVWENCARILCEKEDEELEGILCSLMEWLQDLNWPGALLIQERLRHFEKKEKREEAKCTCMAEAVRQGNSVWLSNMMEINEQGERA